MEESPEGVKLREWLRAAGGTVSARISLCVDIPGEGRGVVVGKDGMVENELLFAIPGPVVLDACDPSGFLSGVPLSPYVRLCVLLLAEAASGRVAPYVESLPANCGGGLQWDDCCVRVVAASSAALRHANYPRGRCASVVEREGIRQALATRGREDLAKLCTDDALLW
eukprot:Hpha_TRINITY_DN4344_c0_g1::TRINITY_DN4344_c0_g1_i1::g.50238::m.50238